MAEQDNTIKTTVILNTNQAEQQIVKLNAAATDSTKSLESRLAAKNKQVELQNQLSKQTINALNNERRTLEGRGATEKELMAIKVKLDKANLSALKTSENNTKVQNKLAEAYRNSKSPVENLDKATGGLINKMKLFLANPIGIVLTALVGLFQLVKTSMNATEEGAASMNAVMAAVGQIFTNIVTVVADLVQPIFEWLAGFLSRDLGEAFEAMGGYIDAVKLGFEAFYNAVILGLTPLRTLIALATAAGQVASGNFEAAKQTMIDFKQSVIDAATAVGTNLVAALDKAVETNSKVEEAFNNSTDAGNSLIALAAQIELRQLAFNKAKRNQELQDAKLGVLARVALADSKNLEKSFADRYKSLQKFQDIELEREGKRQAILKTEIQLLEDRASLGKNTQADNEALNQLYIQREQAQERLANQVLIFNRYSKEFYLNEKKERAAQQKAEIELEEIKIQRLRDNRTITLNEEKIFLDKKMALELSNDELTEIQKEVIRQSFIDSANELDRAERDRKLEEKNMQVDVDIAYAEAELERLRERGDSVLALELEILDRKRQQELENEDLTGAEIQAINDKYNLIEIQTTRKTKDAIKKSVDAAARKGAEAAADAFGISQELRIAQLVMAAPEAVGNSFTKATEVYAPPVSIAMGALGAAGVIVPIIKGLADIKKQRFPGSKRGGGGGSISMPSSGGRSSVSATAVTDIAANNSARLGIDPSLGLNAGANAANNVVGSTSPNVVFSENKYNDFQNQITFKEDKTTI